MTKLVRAAIIAVVVVSAQPLASVSADGHADAGRRQEEVRQQRAAAAAQVDVLRASEAEVAAALTTLEGNVAAERLLLDDANRRVDQAVAEVAADRAEEARLEGELAQMRELLRALAVDEFVTGPSRTVDPLLLLDAADAGEATKARYLADLEVERHDDLADRLAQLHRDLAAQRRAAERAEVVAEEERGAAAARVAAVEAARDEQAGFVAEVEAELERSLAEAAALERLDQELAARIVQGEKAMADRLAAEAARSGAAASAASSGAVRRSAESVPVVPAGGGMVSVRGIVVSRSIASNLTGLLGAADAAGISFGGGGYRDPAAQQRLRQQNCPDPQRSPAGACRPPTARPGQSMHERGLAVDFTVGGQIVSSRGSAAYRWLAANAGRFGFRNLPAEPWHWSTNGE